MFTQEDIRPDGFFNTTNHMDLQDLIGLISEDLGWHLYCDVEEPLFQQFIIDMFYRWNMDRGGPNLKVPKTPKDPHDPFGFYPWIYSQPLLRWPSFIKLREIDETYKR